MGIDKKSAQIIRLYASVAFFVVIELWVWYHIGSKQSAIVEKQDEIIKLLREKP